MELYNGSDSLFVKTYFWEILLSVGWLRDMSQEQGESEWVRPSPSIPVRTSRIYSHFICKGLFGQNIIKTAVFNQYYYIINKGPKREGICPKSLSKPPPKLLTRLSCLSSFTYNHHRNTWKCSSFVRVSCQMSEEWNKYQPSNDTASWKVHMVCCYTKS